MNQCGFTKVHRIISGTEYSDEEESALKLWKKHLIHACLQLEITLNDAFANWKKY